jgi:hypothetical protein
MFERFAKALKVAVRDEGFAQIPGTGVLLVIVGTQFHSLFADLRKLAWTEARSRGSPGT